MYNVILQMTNEDHTIELARCSANAALTVPHDFTGYMLETETEYSFIRKEYYLNGMTHRDPNQGPAFENNNMFKYYVDGKIHRVSGPAVIMYTDKSRTKLEREVWFQNDQMHNIEGPADICYHYHKNGTVRLISKRYYYRGKETNEEALSLLRALNTIRGEDLL